MDLAGMAVALMDLAAMDVAVMEVEMNGRIILKRGVGTKSSTVQRARA